MPTLTFKYYQGKQKRSNGGDIPADGDIIKKYQQLTALPSTPYSGLPLSQVCAIAMSEWLADVKVLAVAPLPEIKAPLAQAPTQVSFTYAEAKYGDIKGKLRALKEVPQSLYRHQTNAAIYILGINAWLDGKLAELA
ncbi:MAG: hypothetical protein ACOYL5_01740 [Phototrophicaceae bacterium]|jgi:hypothetical protein